MGSRGFQGGAVRFKEVQGGSYIKEKREEDYLPHGFHFSPGRDGSTNYGKVWGGVELAFSPHCSRGFIFSVIHTFLWESIYSTRSRGIYNLFPYYGRSQCLLRPEGRGREQMDI